MKAPLAYAGLSLGAAFFVAQAIPAQAASKPTVALATQGGSGKIAEEVSTAPGAKAGRERLPSDSAQPPARSKEGTLRLRVVDDASGAPLGDLPFAVFSERGGDKLLAEGRTDSSGAAIVGALAENTILVQTRRRPPHAIGFGALWMRAGKTRELEVRVGKGGALVGRVVDDLGLPRAGLEVHVDTGPIARSFKGCRIAVELVAITDSDGRFRVEHAISTPRGVWIVDEKPKPESWVDASVEIRDPRFGALDAMRVGKLVREGEVSELDRIVFARASRISGTVLDALDQPVAGALVSCRFDRIASMMMAVREDGPRLAPWQEGFESRPGETLTDAAGRFALDLAAGNPQILVWTHEGRREQFRLGRTAPGEYRTDLLWRLRGDNLLELELRGSDGRLAKDRIDSPPEGTYTTWGRLGFPGQVAVQVGLEDGTLEKLSNRPDPDGILRLQLDAPLAQIRSCDVLAPGYLFHRAELPLGLESGGRLALELSEQPCLEVEVRWAQANDAPAESLNLTVQACLGSPQAGKLSERWHACCGLGSTVRGAWTGAGTFQLPVQLEDDAYWVIVSGRGPGWALEHSAHGPFRASGGTKRIELSRDLLQSAPPFSNGRGLSELGYSGCSFGVSDDGSGSAFRGRLLLADGQSPPKGTHVRARSCEQSPDADGRFELRGDLPESFSLIVTDGSNSTQWIRIPAWTPDQELELRMAPWREVIVRLRGLDERHRYSLLGLTIHHSSADSSEDPLALGIELAPEGAARRFAFRLAPGLHDLEVNSALYELCSESVSIAESDTGPQVVDATVRRK